MGWRWFKIKRKKQTLDVKIRQILTRWLGNGSVAKAGSRQLRRLFERQRPSLVVDDAGVKTILNQLRREEITEDEAVSRIIDQAGRPQS